MSNNSVQRHFATNMSTAQTSGSTHIRQKLKKTCYNLSARTITNLDSTRVF